MSTRNIVVIHLIDDEIVDSNFLIKFFNKDGKLNLRLAPKVNNNQRYNKGIVKV